MESVYTQDCCLGAENRIWPYLSSASASISSLRNVRIYLVARTLLGCIVWVCMGWIQGVNRLLRWSRYLESSHWLTPLGTQTNLWLYLVPGRIWRLCDFCDSSPVVPTIGAWGLLEGIPRSIAAKLCIVLFRPKRMEAPKTIFPTTPQNLHKLRKNYWRGHWKLPWHVTFALVEKVQ